MFADFNWFNHIISHNTIPLIIRKYFINFSDISVTLYRYGTIIC